MNMTAETLVPDRDLRDLLRGLALAPDIRVSGISSDSRQVQKGDLFLATAGARSHGLDYVNDVVRAGAAAEGGLQFFSMFGKHRTVRHRRAADRR